MDSQGQGQGLTSLQTEVLIKRLQSVTGQDVRQEFLMRTMMMSLQLLRDSNPA